MHYAITAESGGEKKSVNICRSYGQESKWVFFLNTVYRAIFFIHLNKEKI